jgi:hypothetical protein
MDKPEELIERIVHSFLAEAKMRNNLFYLNATSREIAAFLIKHFEIQIKKKSTNE